MIIINQIYSGIHRSCDKRKRNIIVLYEYSIIYHQVKEEPYKRQGKIYIHTKQEQTKKSDSFIFLRVKHFEKCIVQLQRNANSEIVQKEK